MPTPAVTARNRKYAGRFLSFNLIEWTDSHGVARNWESAERVSGAGAVLIVPRLEPSGRILLIRQFRPPAGRDVYEFPAGLIDSGEAAAAAALRELREETGYAATINRVTPPAYTTPGLSDETVYMVEAVIDENAPENARPETHFDPSEMIESIPVKRSDLPDFYQRETARGAAFDAKLAAYIIALGSASGGTA